MLTEHKNVCLSISGTQYVRFEKGSIKFRNYFKQIPVPFKIYGHFDCNLQSVENYEGSYSKTYQDRIPCSFVYELVCVDDEFTKPIVVFIGENAAYEFIKAILKGCQCCKVLNKHFNKNLIMIEEEEGQFQSSNTCWICEKLIVGDDEKVRDHFHITGKCRAQFFGDVIFRELNKFDGKIDVLENILIRKIFWFFFKQKLSVY